MYLLQDWNCNSKNIKGRIILIGFRLAHLASKSKLFFILLIPHLITYRLCVEWILGVEIPYKTRIGTGLSLHHGQSLVINDGTQIGKNCTLRHSTTIGNKKKSDGTYSNCPIIGNNVDIGSNVCIIGEVTIGNNVNIGAGTVITKNIPGNSTAVGNPARIISWHTNAAIEM